MHWRFIWSCKPNWILGNNDYKILRPTWKYKHFFVCLFGSWSFDYVEIVVKCVDEDDTSFLVPKFQVWGNKDNEYAKKIKNISFKGGNVNIKCLEDIF